MRGITLTQRKIEVGPATLQLAEMAFGRCRASSSEIEILVSGYPIVVQEAASQAHNTHQSLIAHRVLRIQYASKSGCGCRSTMVLTQRR
jgi:hypothetical protein